MHLGWLPTQGMAPLLSRASGLGWLVERLRYLALPALTFAVHEATRAARIMRASVQETLGQGYIITARAKGLSRNAIIWRHVLRNSSLPVVTVMGYAFGVAMGGAVLIETVFSWPGIGLLLIDAIRARDNQTIVGVVLFISFAVILDEPDRGPALLRCSIRASARAADEADGRLIITERRSAASRAEAAGSAASTPARPSRTAATAPFGLAGLAILGFLLLLAVAAPWIAPFGPLQQIAESLEPPSCGASFGHRQYRPRHLLARDLRHAALRLPSASAPLRGARWSGGTVGILAGYSRGAVEAVLMRVAELFQTLPVIMCVLFAVALFGTSFWLLIAAVTLAIWPVEARLIYGQFISCANASSSPRPRSSRTCPTPHIIVREILPNAMQPVIVQVALDASIAILIEVGPRLPRAFRPEHGQLGPAALHRAGLPGPAPGG